MAEDTMIIDEIVARARTAQARYEAMGSQALFDKACLAVAWVLMQPERNRALAEMAVEETGLGNADDKVRKNHNKTLGLMRDIKDITAFGHVEDDDENGLSIYYRPKGVIAAVVPSTNPLATPVNNTINALKTGNAIILAPSPKGVKPLLALFEHIHPALAKLGLPEDLVQMVPAPPSKPKTERLMQLADLVVRHRITGECPRRLFIGHPCARRRGGQCRLDRRRDGRHRRCGSQDRRLQDLRQRHILFFRKRGDCRRCCL